MKKEYDLVIIGGGPGGYVAALRGVQLGLSVALVEKNKIGGVCLHSGCIPSKSLIKSSAIYQEIISSSSFGINVEKVSFDFKSVKNRAFTVVNTLHRGVQTLMDKSKVDIYYAHASLMGSSIFSPMPGSVAIPATNSSEEVVLVPKNVILAVGTSVSTIPGIEVDNDVVITSDTAFNLDSLPESIIIIGGGFIGIEWADMFNSFGVKVTIIEKGPSILPLEDTDISTALTNDLTKKGINIVVNANIDISQTLKKSDKISFTVLFDNINNKKQVFTASKAMIATGRSPKLHDLGLQNTKVTKDKQGFIEVDKDFRTKEKHIFAIGDVNGFLPLAHSASAQGTYVVEYLKGLNPHHINKHNIPRCVYTNPEIASIGLTEAEAKKAGYKVKVSKSNFSGNSKAIISNNNSGFIKIIASHDNDDILGVHTIGPDVTNMISQISLAKFLDASAWELGKAIYPHPSLSENFMEAALDIHKQSIHKHY